MKKSLLNKFFLKLVVTLNFLKSTILKNVLKPSFKKAVIYLLVGIACTHNQYAQATYTSESTAAQLATQLTNPGFTITNPVITNGDVVQRGTFSNGIVGAGLELDSGIILTTSSVNQVFDNNSSAYSGNSIQASTYNDIDLTNIVSEATSDVMIFEFDFIITGTQPQIFALDYQFASEEYPIYVCSEYNDIFGFFVSGGDLDKTINLANVGGVNVSVNDINSGVIGPLGDPNQNPCQLLNSNLFIDNNEVNGPIQVIFNGLTETLRAYTILRPNISYHMKMAIADTFDSVYDSGIFISPINIFPIPPEAEIDFDGVDDFIMTAPFLGDKTSGTMSAWVKLDNAFNTTGDIIGQSNFKLFVDNNRRLKTSAKTGSLKQTYKLTLYDNSPSNPSWGTGYVQIRINSGPWLPFYIDGVFTNQLVSRKFQNENFLPFVATPGDNIELSYTRESATDMQTQEIGFRITDENDIIIHDSPLGAVKTSTTWNYTSVCTTCSTTQSLETPDADAPILETDLWYHITSKFDGTNGSLTLYLNGSQVWTDTGLAGNFHIKDDDSSFIIGKNSASNDRYFKGAIDEVKFFEKALTDSEIQEQIYQEIENNGALVTGKQIPKPIGDGALNWSDLSLYYDMNLIYEPGIIDLSLNSRNGLLRNILTIQPQTAPMPYETVSDGNWNEEATWLHGDVWDIEDTANNKPWSIAHIKNDINTSSSHTQLGMIIDAPNTLTVTGNNEINNSGYLQLDGTLDLTGDSQLIQGSNSDLVTSATGKILRRQEGNSNLYWYNYWSSPVGTLGATILSNNNGATNNLNNSNFNLAMLKDGAGTAMEFTSSLEEVGKISDQWLFSFLNGQDYSDWIALTPSSTIAPGIGYTQKGTGVANANGNQEYIFEGKPNNGTILVTADDIDGDSADESTEGTTLTTTFVGNPYPSALDADKFIMDNLGIINNTAPAIQGTLLLWEQWAGDSHILAEYQGGYGYINLTETERAYQHPDISIANPVNGDNRGIKTPTRFIPVGQGFFVEVINDGDIEFNNSQRVFKNQTLGESVFLRNTASSNSNTSESEQNNMQIIRLEFAVSNGATRRFVLGFSDHTTDGMDYGYDGGFIAQTPEEDMTSLLGDKSFVIQALSTITEDKVIDLAFNSSGDYTYSLDIVELKHIDENQGIYLQDYQENILWDLREGPYTFSAISGENHERFDIVFKNDQTLSNNDNVLDKTIIYVNNNESKLFIKGLNQEAKNISLNNMLGQTIKSMTNVSTNTMNNGISIQNLSSGVYIVNIKTENNNQLSKKIILE